VLRAPDVNTEVSSSGTSDVNGEASSASEQDVNQATEGEENSQEEAIGSETSEDATGEQEASDQQNDSQEKGEGQEQEAKHEEAIPYERFQEVNNKVTEYEKQIEQSKPLVQQATAIQDFLRTNNISTQEFQSALQYLQALRNDPVAAFKMLKPTYEQLAQFSGEVLPGDLQSKVAAGTMELADAQEIAKARAQQNYQQVRSQWQQQGGQQTADGAVQQSIVLWEQTKRTIEPDLKPGTDLYNLVDKNIRALPKFQTPEQAMAGCEQALKDAKAFFAKYAPRTAPTNKKALTSRHSATGNNLVFKTAEEVARFIGAGGKPEQVRYA